MDSIRVYRASKAAQTNTINFDTDGKTKKESIRYNDGLPAMDLIEGSP